jgi:hypothetical protein
MNKLDMSKGAYNKAIMDHLDALDTRMKYRCLSNPGVVIGSTAPEKVKITNTTVFLFNGVFGSKSTAEVAFTATTHDILNNVASVQEAMYLLSFSAVDGTPALTMGAIATGSGAAVLPEIPAAHTPVGAVRVAVAAGATPFDASTDSLAAGHITDTYYSYGWLAPRFDAVV